METEQLIQAQPKQQASKKIKVPWAKHQQRWFGKWHVYLGIIAGFIIVIVGVTGSILVFQDNIDRLLNKDLLLVQQQQKKLSIETVSEIVKQNHPELKFDYVLNKTDEPNHAYSFYNFTTEEEFFANPYTGELSGKRLYESSFIHIVTEIHTTLLIPAVGRYIVGIASLVLVILTITGLRLWIPAKWKQLKAVITVKFGASFKRQNLDWHNVIGFYTAPVVSLLALTGFCITFSVVVIPMLFVLSGKSPQNVAQIFATKSDYVANAKPLSLKELSAIAQKQMPESRIAGIAFPADSSGVYRFDMLSPGLPEDGKREMIMVDQYNGSIKLNSRIDFPNVGNAYLSWLTPIHYGSFGGLPTQIIAIIGGLSPLVLFITGFIIWYPRWRKQKRSAEKQAAKKGAPFITSIRSVVEETLVKPKTIQYLWLQLKQGFKYASWLILIAAVMGALYGIFSGIVIQPAVFAIAFTAVLVILNFIVALLCILFNIIFLAPFKKGSRLLIKYFALSGSFFVVFLTAYMLILNTGLLIF